jgi:hypothetical protein
VSDYGLDDRAIEVRSLAEANHFYYSLCVQTCSGADTASYPVGAGVISSGLKSGRGGTLTTHAPSSAEVKNEYELYLLSPKYLFSV